MTSGLAAETPGRPSGSTRLEARALRWIARPALGPSDAAGRDPKEPTLGRSRDDARARAEREFAKQKKTDDAATEFKAGRATEERAFDEKTSRLKALRLAKEAAEPAPAPSPKKAWRKR